MTCNKDTTTRQVLNDFIAKYEGGRWVRPPPPTFKTEGNVSNSRFFSFLFLCQFLDIKSAVSLFSIQGKLSGVGVGGGTIREVQLRCSSPSFIGKNRWKLFRLASKKDFTHWAYAFTYAHMRRARC